MSDHIDPELEAMARTLEASGEYRVIRKYHAPPATTLTAGMGDAGGLLIDLETTGLNPGDDRIIQLAVVPFRFVRETGVIVGAGAPVVCFEDPGRPIPPEIVKLTGITDQDVQGQRIDDVLVESLAGANALVIAHNAEFDRPFSERRLPFFRDRHWACSRREIPWRTRGLGSSALEFLLMRHAGVFHDGHRADHDCLALLHLLGTPFDSGETPFQLLLASARRKSYRIWATGSPFDRKDELKRRGYRFKGARGKKPACWYRDVSASEEPAERAWLAEAMYGGDASRFQVETLDSKTRYSDRDD